MTVYDVNNVDLTRYDKVAVYCPEADLSTEAILVTRGNVGKLALTFGEDLRLASDEDQGFFVFFTNFRRGDGVENVRVAPGCWIFSVKGELKLLPYDPFASTFQPVGDDPLYSNPEAPQINLKQYLTMSKNQWAPSAHFGVDAWGKVKKLYDPNLDPGRLEANFMSGLKRDLEMHTSEGTEWPFHKDDVVKVVSGSESMIGYKGIVTGSSNNGEDVDVDFGEQGRWMMHYTWLEKTTIGNLHVLKEPLFNLGETVRINAHGTMYDGYDGVVSFVHPDGADIEIPNDKGVPPTTLYVRNDQMIGISQDAKEDQKA